MGCFFSSVVLSTASPHPQPRPARRRKVTKHDDAVVALMAPVPRHVHLFFGNSLPNTLLPFLRPVPGLGSEKQDAGKASA